MVALHTRIRRAMVRTVRLQDGILAIEVEVDGQMLRMFTEDAADLCQALRRHMPLLTGEREFVRPDPNVVQLRAELAGGSGE